MKKKGIHLRISENNAGTAGIFYSKLGLAILTCDATLKTRASVACNHQNRGGPYRWPLKGDLHGESSHP
jgi:hypothetical protein